VEVKKLPKIFYAAHPVDWCTRNEAEAIVGAATEHFHDNSARDELVARGKIGNWFPYELKMFSTLPRAAIANSASRAFRCRQTGSLRSHRYELGPSRLRISLPMLSRLVFQRG